MCKLAFLLVLVPLVALAALGCEQTQSPTAPFDSEQPTGTGPNLLTLLSVPSNVNIAEGAPVALTGSFFTGGWGGGSLVAPSTVVDGIFLGRSTQWDQGPVWWDTHDGGLRYLTIDLEGTYRIESLIVQADDNDSYILSYWNLGLADWDVAWSVPNYNPLGWGMQTRPNPADDGEKYDLPTPIETDALRFEMNTPDSDDYGAVSEIQAFGVRILDMDIKPGSFPNSINPRSNGVVPVAILGSNEFDVEDVDVTTLEFGPWGATPAHDLANSVTHTGHLQDVNADGYTDLVSHYRQKMTGFQTGNTEGCVTGETLGGIPFEGRDSVRIL
jgi:hypothetical protein